MFFAHDWPMLLLFPLVPEIKKTTLLDLKDCKALSSPSSLGHVEMVAYKYPSVALVGGQGVNDRNNCSHRQGQSGV